MASVDMREILLERHGISPPNTHNHGRLPIDGIFATPAITIIKGGYHGFGDAIPGNHRCLWFDISFANVFGHDLPQRVRAKARRLKMHDPRTSSNFNIQYFQEIERHRLEEQAFYLESRCSFPLSPHHATMWEAIDRIQIQSYFHAKSRCHKLFMGGVPWSPEIQVARS